MKINLLGDEKMPFYNMAAEYASLVIISLAIVGFAIDENKGTTRYQALKWMQYATLLSIVVTIGSLLTADYFMLFPVWVVDILKYLYFLTASIAAPMAYFYQITLIYPKTYKINFFKKHVLAWLPYVIYCCFVLANPIHRLIFTISPTEGYIRGELFRITYVIALFYALLVVIFAIKHFKTPQRNVLLIICLNLFVASLIFCTQLFFPPLQLSGLASVTGVLIIQFYVQNISHRADPLTEFYNRTTLTTHMSKLHKANENYSLFVFSIRNFKGINERNGLKFGDDLLEQIAARMRTSLPQRHLFRYSGDEFAILMPNCGEKGQSKIDEICTGMGEPYDIAGNKIMIDFVYARVDFPDFGRETEEIISAIDYSVSLIKKEAGSVYFYYDKSVCDLMKRRNYIIERIKVALDTDGFEAYYQPIYSVKEKDFTIAEALIRFNPNQGEFISPGEFIPIAEETGFIEKITNTMINLVASDYKKMEEALGKDLKIESISINFPYTFFMKPGAAEDVSKIVGEYGVSPEMINMELTERVLVSDIEKTLKIMKEFSDKGFMFELDDFGVEYSNFSMLFKVPIRVVKFDRSLVVTSTATSKRREFFRQFVLAMKSMDKEIEIVMEGVEDEELKDFLIECGGDYIQGFVFSKPLPKEEFIKFISTEKGN